jgi:hypothetical protein
MAKISIKNFDRFDDSSYMNTMSYQNYYERLRLLTTSMFKWTFPKDLQIAKRFIENSLFTEGKLAFFKHKDYGYIVTKCTPNDQVNLYNEYISYQCYSDNGYINESVPADKCVIIRNNMQEIPTFYLLQLFIRRLYNIERTIDVNLQQQKTPVLITCAESQKLTMKNLYMKVEGNEPVIFGNDKLNVDGISVFKTDAPFIADKLEDIKERKWNECLAMLGINNANTQKKERLVTDEVNANNQLINLESDTFLLSRQDACDEIKEKFGIDIQVEMRHKIEDIVADMEGGETENE